MRLAHLVLAAPVLLIACAKQQIQPRYAPGVSVASITVTSPSIPEGGHIPVDCTCDGTEIMPEIVLSSPPPGTQSLVIQVEDPDAANGTYIHMVAFNLAPDLHKLAAGQDLAGAGENARFGLNDASVPRYSGPCPPKGEAHRYRWHVLALDTVLKLPEGTPNNQINEAIDGHIIGEGALTGQFGH